MQNFLVTRPYKITKSTARGLEFQHRLCFLIPKEYFFETSKSTPSYEYFQPNRRCGLCQFFACWVCRVPRINQCSCNCFYVFEIHVKFDVWNFKRLMKFLTLVRFIHLIPKYWNFFLLKTSESTASIDILSHSGGAYSLFSVCLAFWSVFLHKLKKQA